MAAQAPAASAPSPLLGTPLALWHIDGGGMVMEWLARLEDAKAAPIPAGKRSAELMAHGTMTLRYYAPEGHDPQTPHDQDEIYVVVAGSGTFALGPDEASLERQPFGPGDAIFAPAGWLHRFEDFSSDFATWVIFWGPEGGEAGA